MTNLKSKRKDKYNKFYIQDFIKALKRDTN